MAERFVLPVASVFDGNGDVGAGWKLNFYQTGTSTPQDTYSDSAGTTPNANPVVADAAGRFGDIFLAASPAYKVVLTDASDVVIWTKDPVSPPAATSAASQAQVDARTATGVFIEPAKIADGIGLQGSSIASAAALDLPAVGDYFTVTGTTAITSIESRTAGRRVRLRFLGALTLTHNATSLVLPTGANITTIAGDVVELVSEGGGNWRCSNYERNGGLPLSRDPTCIITVGPASGATVAAGATVFLGPMGSNATEGTITFPSPIAGTIRNLQTSCSAFAGAGQSFTYTVRVGGADTSVVATVTGAAAATGSDTTNAATVAVGSLISVKLVTSAGAGVGAHNVSFELRRS